MAARPGWKGLRYVLTGVAVPAVALLVGAWAQDPPQPSFRSAVDLTVLEVTVRSREGRLLTELRRDDFQITERGRPVVIEHFSVDRQPVTAALMVLTFADIRLHRDIAQSFAAGRSRTAIG